MAAGDIPEPTPAEAQGGAAAAAPSPPRWHLGWRLLVGALALCVLLATALAGTALWLARSEGGARWLLAQAPGLEVTGWRGPLLGDGFSADQLVVEMAGTRVTLTGLVAEGLQWRWRPDGAAWVGLNARQLSAATIVVTSGPPSGKPLTEPAALVWPLRLRVDSLRVGQLQIDSQAPLTGIDAAIEIGAQQGAQHRIERLRLTRDRVQLMGSAQVASAAPLALQADLQMAPLAAGAPALAPGWAAVLRASGPLARLDLQGTLRGVPQAGRAAPSADLRATVTPFETWPLAALSAQTDALDLGALASAAPETRLSGSVQVDSRAADAPVGARVELVNQAPGRWDEGRLPLQRIVLALRGQLSQPDRVAIETFDLLLGSPARPAGRWKGSGEWHGDSLRLDTQLADVQPQALDGRAAAMRLSGSLSASVQGLPSLQARPDAVVTPWRVALRTQLEGRLTAAPQPVQIMLDATADAHRIEIRQLRATAGTALADLRGSAQRSAGASAGPWQLATQGNLQQFDPLPWWPGSADAAWRQGPHRLSATWQLDLRLPADAGRLAPLALLQRVAGSGTLSVRDSVLAGVPLQADLTLGSSPGNGPAASQLQGELLAAGNVLRFIGQGDPRGLGDADRWSVELKADALPALAPWFRLVPGGAAWAPRQGSVQAQARLTGRWPAMSTEGDATLAQLQMGTLALDSAKARWRLATQGTQALELDADATGLRWGAQRADRLHAEVRGTPERHRIELSAALPLAPPPIAEQVFGLRTLSGTRATVLGEGAWQRDPAGGGRWRGRVAQLAAGAWDGKTVGGSAGTDWLDARDLSADLHFDAGGSLDQLEAAPGRLRLANAVELRWDAVRVDLRGAQPAIDLRAEIDPFRVAPLLARLQPTMGWSGDLRLGGRMEIKAAERFDADIVIERRDGDLMVAEEGGNQALGLSDLQASLVARDGQWTFAQALAGRAIGEAAGAVNVRTTPERRWPAPDAPLDGVLQARVASLGIWGAWVPPGWRMTGELTTSATIGGTFAAPEYTGEMRGTGLGVRNLLQGVNVTQGEVLVLLKGATAQIERFTLKAGEGSLELSGGADFGTAPNARLVLKAQRFRALGRIDRQLTASGNAELLLKADQIKLDGKLVIDEALFDISRGNAPTLDDDVTIKLADAPAAPSDSQAGTKPRRAPEVDLEIGLGEKLRVRGHGVDTGLRGRLRVSAPGGRLAVRGTVNAVDGNYAAYGQKLVIDRGIVAFTGAVDNPRLDVLALRPNLDIKAGVAITGTAQLPRIRLYSDPDMSDTDKLSWLMLGRAPDGLGTADTALLQRAAVALLAGEGDAPTDQLLRNIGLDELSLRQTDGDARDTVVSIGKQISRRWYVGYERGVNAASGTWQLIYRIAQRFTLRAQSGNENSLDLIWVWRVGEPVLGSVPKSQAAPP